MDFVGKRSIWFTMSLVIIVLGLLFLGIRGLNLGIDFAGGSLFEYSFAEEVSTGEFINILAELDLDAGAIVQPSQEEGVEGILARTTTATTAQAEELHSILRDRYPGVEQLRYESVEETIGAELRWQALMAIFAASVALVGYISIRFELKYALAAIIALLHDMLIVIGIFAIFHQEINTPFVAALLTVAGYSINDSIVIFDRIRENLRYSRYKDFNELLNASVTETLPRSIYTSMTTLLCILAIIILGGASIRAFMLALAVGFVSGTYSSIFIASPVLVVLRDAIPRFRTSASS